MLTEELPEEVCGFEERLRVLESRLHMEQELRGMLEKRVQQLERMAVKYDLLPEEDNETEEADGFGKWLALNLRPKKQPKLLLIRKQLKVYWKNGSYQITAKGHRRVEVFQLFNEMKDCIDTTQKAFIEQLIAYTNLGNNPSTIKSNLRYAAVKTDGK